jgi:hypothetical protein
MIKQLATAAAVMALAGSAFAANSDQAAPAEQKAKDRKICETVVDTGSIRTKRVCRTVAEKKSDEQQSGRSLDDMRRARQNSAMTSAALGR